MFDFAKFSRNCLTKEQKYDRLVWFKNLSRNVFEQGAYIALPTNRPKQNLGLVSPILFSTSRSRQLVRSLLQQFIYRVTVLLGTGIPTRKNTVTDKYKKTLLTLPAEVSEAFANLAQGSHPEQRDAYIHNLRQRGWTLQSIAEASGVTRERVRQIAAQTDVDELRLDINFPLPSPPKIEEKPKRVFVEPSPATLERLLELQPFAHQVRSHSPKFREEAEEYTALLWQAHRPIEDGGEGVTLYRLALRLGVTHGALRFRLARYEYKVPAKGTSKVYSPILSRNRAL